MASYLSISQDETCVIPWCLVWGNRDWPIWPSRNASSRDSEPSNKVRWIRDVGMNMTAGEVLQCEDLARREKRQRRAGVSRMVLLRSQELKWNHSELEPRTQGNISQFSSFGWISWHISTGGSSIPIVPMKKKAGNLPIQALRQSSPPLECDIPTRSSWISPWGNRSCSG